VPRLHGGAKDHHVDRHPHPAAQQGVFADGDQFTLLFGSHGLVGYLGHFAPNENRALFLAAAIELLIAFAETAHVDVKIVDFGVVTDFFLD